jgi:hypothetical protein
MVDIKKYLPKSKEEDDHEYLWALIIEPGWVQAGIWRVDNKKAQIIFTSTPNAWEEDNLVDAVDTALSSAIKNFPDDLEEPQKTVFGVVSSWVKGGEIKEEYLEKIKDICKELSLKPVGFVVLSEAIAHYRKTEEGAPLSAVVAGIYQEEMELSVFKIGNLAGNTKVARSMSLAEDISEGISRFSLKENIPSRFILYDGREGELEDARQSLLKANWDDYENVKFLHTPKVEIVDSKEKIYAVSLAGASELAEITGLEVLGSEDEVHEEEKPEQKPAEEAEETTPEDLGFVVNKDIEKVTEKESKEETREDMEEESEAIESIHENVEPVEEDFDRPKKKLPLSLGPLKNFVAGVAGFAKKIRIPTRFAGSQKPLIFGLAFLVLLIAAGGYAWWFLPKASITVYVAPKKLDEDVSVEVDPGISQTDFENKILAADEIETSVTGDRTKQTSGTKTVGEKAKGEITLYRSGSKITLDAGEVLTGPSKLKFTLDNDVEVASGSPSSPGTTKVSVTANEIGAEYNLAANSNFTVDDYSISDIDAKNENSFSGGTSREINAVSEADQESLESELMDELEGKAKDELKSQTGSGDYLIEESLTGEPSSVSFSNKVGDEADSLKLSMTLDASAVVVNRDDLMKLVQEAMKDKVPNGFVLRESQIDIEFRDVTEEDGKYKMEARVAANLLPQVNTEEIAVKVAGKYPSIVEEYLPKEVPGFVRAEIKLEPALPGRLGTLPRVSKNIKVDVAAER